MPPSKFIELSPEEKAFIVACIDLKIEAEKKKQKEIERKSRKKK